MTDASALAPRRRAARRHRATGDGHRRFHEPAALRSLRLGVAAQLARLDDIGLPNGRWWYVLRRILAFTVGLGLVAIDIARIVHGSPGQVGAGLVGLAALGLLRWRDRYPLGVLIGEVGLALAETGLHSTREDDWSIILVVVALYEVAVHRPGGTSLPAMVGTWVVGGGASVLLGQPAGGLFSLLFMCATATAVGLYVRSYRALISSLRERAEQAERERRWSTSQAVVAERVRIARELHDVVAHHVSLLVVQAGAVRAGLEPGDRSYEVVDSMVRGGRQAMTELRDMLGALRLTDPQQEEDGSAPGVGEDLVSRRPQPDVRQVWDLVSGARRAGLPVELTEQGQPAAGSSAAAFAAYRIVQEALTNVVRHSPGAPTSVRIDHRSDGIGLTVRNGPSVQLPDPVEERALSGGHPGGAPGGGGAGHGLLGMRERAALCGGWVQAGSQGDGYQVAAWLPQSRDEP